MTNVEHVEQLSPGSHANILWNHNTHEVDPDPLFAPKSAPLCSIPVKAVKRSSVSRPVQPVKWNISLLGFCASPKCEYC